jgi:excisionase family DNA binding protein
MEKSTMSVQDLARQMGISLPKAYALVKETDFPTLRIGTRILIPVEGFQAWLRAKSGSGDA